MKIDQGEEEERRDSIADDGPLSPEQDVLPLRSTIFSALLFLDDIV